MKFLKWILIFIPIAAQAANPSFDSFNTNDFSKGGQSTNGNVRINTSRFTPYFTNRYAKFVDINGTNTMEDGTILRPYASFENPITNGASMVYITPGSYVGIGQASGLAMQITNDIIVVAEGSILHRFLFAPRTNNFTMYGGIIDYLTDQVIGPVINLSFGPSNCVVRFYNTVWLVYSDGIKNGTAHSGFRFEAYSCTFYDGFQAVNNCVGDSTNVVFQFNQCNWVNTNNTGPVFQPGINDRSTWILNQNTFSGYGPQINPRGTNIVIINGGTITSTNGDWCIDAESYSTVYIKGSPCPRTLVTNGPNATIVWLDDSNLLSFVTGVATLADGTKVDTNAGTMFSPRSDKLTVTNNDGFGISAVISNYQVYIAGSLVVDIQTNFVMTGSSGGASGTVKNKAWGRQDATTLTNTSATKVITNNAPGSYQICSPYPTPLGTNTTLFGRYISAADGTTFYCDVVATNFVYNGGLSTNLPISNSGGTVTNLLQFSGGVLKAVVP